MFRIKICGVTSAADAATAAALGADAVGINFYGGSPRCVAPSEAAAIVRAVRGKALAVGVFVNEDPDVVLSLCRDTGIKAVQLSGDEPAAVADRIPPPRIRTIRIGDERESGIFKNYPCEAFLLDGCAPGAYGGTGRALDWTAIGEMKRSPEGGFLADILRGRTWILAGGLSPANVGRAIRLAHPHGVDVASGVEISPGRKDAGMMKRFIRNARKGFGIAEA
jgi:phosphoribosylanthranilate isomerase